MASVTYWLEEYGIATEEHFISEVSSFLPNFRLWGIGWETEQVARAAYYGPFTTLGDIANGGLYLKKKLGLLDPEARDLALKRAAGAVQEGALGMAPLVIQGVFRVAIEAESGGQPVVNVVGLRRNAAQTAIQAAEATRTAWTAANGPMTRLPAAYGLRMVRAMDLSSVDGAIGEASSALNGSAVSNTLATNAACALVKWNGGTRSGSSRGRLYFGPLTEADVNADGRTVAQTSRDAIVGAMNVFKTSLSNAGFTLCVISRTRASATDVTSLTVETVLASQRRRIRS